MTPILVEAANALRRLARRRVVLAVGAVDALWLLVTVVQDPAESARAALAMGAVLASLTVIVLSAGIVADDRAAGRLAVAAAHPARQSHWVIGRWLAVFGAGVAVAAFAACVLLVAVPAPLDVPGIALGWAAEAVYVAALAGLAVALSCVVGSTPQIFALLAVLVLGALPPDAVVRGLGGAWITGLARGLWTLLPTPWSLGRLHGWAFGSGGSAPVTALMLVLQVALWLGAGARALGRAELAARSAG